MPQNEKKSSIAAVVVTYNRLDLLRQCVDALRAQSAACDILIIDNASTDGTGQWAAEQSGLRYRNTGANLGGAGGFSFGIRWAAEEGYDRLWIMDDDTLPKPDALQKLLEAEEILGGNYGWLSSVALWLDGSTCRMNEQLPRRYCGESMPLLKYGLLRAERASFVSMFLRRETVMQVGLPFAEFFIWGDDAEFSRRIAVRAGLPSYVVGQSQVVHATKNNDGMSLATDSEARIDRYWYSYRNEGFMLRKEGFSGVSRYLYRCARDFAAVLVKAPTKKGKRLRTLLRGMWAALLFHPKIEYLKETVLR